MNMESHFVLREYDFLTNQACSLLSFCGISQMPFEQLKVLPFPLKMTVPLTDASLALTSGDHRPAMAFCGRKQRGSLFPLQFWTECFFGPF